MSGNEEQAKLMDETFTSYKASEGEQERQEQPEVPAEEDQEKPETGVEEETEGEEEPTAEEELESLLLGESETDELEEPEEPEVEGEDEPEEPESSGEGEGEVEEEISFDIDNDTFEEITTSPESLANFAKDIYNKGVKAAKKEVKQVREEFNAQLAAAKEEIMKSMPEVVAKSAQRSQTVSQLVGGFYNDYPQLKEKRAYVRDSIRMISSENPGLSAQEVLNKVAEKAQRDLGVSKQAESREKQRKPNPKFAGAGGRRAPSGQQDTRTKQQKLLDETFG